MCSFLEGNDFMIYTLLGCSRIVVAGTAGFATFDSFLFHPTVTTQGGSL